MSILRHLKKHYQVYYQFIELTLEASVKSGIELTTSTSILDAFNLRAEMKIFFL